MIPTKYRNLTQIPDWPCSEQGRALKQCVPEGLRGALRHWSWPEQGKGTRHAPGRFKHAKMSRGPAGLAWWPGILGVWGSRIQAYIGLVNQE